MLRLHIRTCLVTLILLLLVPLVVGGHNWLTIVQHVDSSLARVSHPMPEHGEGSRSTCTGFSINEEQGYFITAYHCLNNGTVVGLKVDNESARLLWASLDLDATVLATQLHRPSLRPRTQAKKGQLIGVLGFGYGLADTIFKSGFIAHPSIPFGVPTQPENWLMVDSPFIAGMSGAPIFNESGDVIALVQQTDGVMGWGHPIDDIYKATRIYWQ